MKAAKTLFETLDTDALRKLALEAQRHGGFITTPQIVLSLLDQIEKQADYLREKNEIIKAYAGPRGRTPEDIAYILESAGVEP